MWICHLKFIHREYEYIGASLLESYSPVEWGCQRVTNCGGGGGDSKLRKGLYSGPTVLVVHVFWLGDPKYRLDFGSLKAEGMTPDRTSRERSLKAMHVKRGDYVVKEDQL